MIGQKFNRLYVLGFSHKDKYRSKYFKCICDCGNETIVKSTNLRTNKTKSCGCLQKEIVSEYCKRNNYKKKKIIQDYFKGGSFKFKENYDLSLKNYIYCFTNLINNKKYIGKSERCLQETIQRYNREFKFNNRLFSRAIKKYGKGNFVFEILEYDIESEFLNDKEKYFISFFNTTDLEIGYNLTDGGEGTSGFKVKNRKKTNRDMSGKNNPFYGKTHSLETRLKIIESNKKRKGERRIKNGK